MQESEKRETGANEATPANGRKARGAGGVRAAGGSFLVLALAVIALALAVRLLFIDRYEVWLDEAYTFLVARKSVGAVLSDTALDNAPPLYYLLLHYWMVVFGDGATALRSLSAVFSAATVAVVVFWRTPWLKRRAALAAGFFLAITPLDIYYAQEARMYSAALFFVAAGMVFLEKGLRGGGARSWALFAVFVILGLYTSYITIFLVPLGYGVILVTYLRDNDRGAARRRLVALLAAHAAAAVLFLPWFPTFWKQPRAAAMQWIGRMAERPNMALLPARSLSVMTVGGAYYPGYLRQLSLEGARVQNMRSEILEGREKRPLAKVLTLIPPPGPYLLTVLVTVALFLAAFRRGGGAFDHRAFLALWLGLPIVVPIFLSVARPLYVVGRYEIMALPAFAVLLGLGLCGLRRALRAGVLVLAALLSFYSWGYMQLFPFTGPGPERGRILAEIAEDGDVVLPLTFQYAPMYYHVGPKRDRLRWVAYPRTLARHSGWIDYERWLEDLPGFEQPRPVLYREALASLAQAVDEAAEGGKIIIVRSFPEPPGWGWNKAMEKAFKDAVAVPDLRGVRPDMELSRPEIGIVVYRKVP